MSVEARVQAFLDRIKKDDGTINAFLHVNPHALAEAAALDTKNGKKGRLYGKVIAVKSNINVKGLICSCASQTLADYTATYDATAIERIKKEDGVIIGMTNMDEFAAGWSGETSAFGPTMNPRAPGHVAGGSSSGSAAAVAAGFCDMALGSETGGSTRVPAAFCGIVGVKPSYGRVSRYGLIDLSMSLDQIAPLAATVDDAALLLDVIAGVDDKDCTSVDYGSMTPLSPTKVRMGVVPLSRVTGAVPAMIERFVAQACKKLHWKASPCTIDYMDVGLQTYFPIVWAEFFSATRRFDGRRYGKKIEDVAGAEVLRRIYGGSEILKAEAAGRYYFKALEAKELITRAFEKAFDDFDCLVLPTSTVLPFTPGTTVRFEELIAIDTLTCPANLAGICAMSLPIGTLEGKPVGLQVMCAKGAEGKMLGIAKALAGISI